MRCVSAGASRRARGPSTPPRRSDSPPPWRACANERIEAQACLIGGTLLRAPGARKPSGARTLENGKELVPPGLASLVVATIAGPVASERAATDDDVHWRLPRSPVLRPPRGAVVGSYLMTWTATKWLRPDRPSRSATPGLLPSCPWHEQRGSAAGWLFRCWQPVGRRRPCTRTNPARTRTAGPVRSGGAAPAWTAARRRGSSVPARTPRLRRRGARRRAPPAAPE